MKIGYACTPLIIPYRTSRTFPLKSLSEENLITCIDSNLNDLLKILEYNSLNNINLFRISSDIIPFGGHLKNTFNWQDYFNEKLKAIGQFIISNSLRVSMHPGQYTVLNSPSSEVVENSIRELIYHCNFLDSLGIDSTHKIILHVGGVYGNKDIAIQSFINNYITLPKNLRNRLVIENDEKNYSFKDLISINKVIHIPLIFDNLHYECYGDFSLSIKECLDIASKTFSNKDGVFKVHYSQQAPDKKTGSHSYTINTNKFLDYYLEFKEFNGDIMFEVKDKNISALKICNTLKELTNHQFYPDIFNELERYSLFLKSKNSYTYKIAEDIAYSSKSFIKFYEYIDKIIYEPSNEKTFLLTLEETFMKYSHNFNSKEVSHFNKLLATNPLKAKEYFFKLSQRYSIQDLLYTYYFY